jgi:hypothetical protein
MRHTRKKESDSTSARLVKKKGKKSKSSINKSPSKKRSLSKRIDRGTKKKTSRTQTRMTKQKAQKTRRPIVTKRTPKLRVSRKSDSQKTKSSSRVFRSPSRKQTATRGVKKKIIRVLGQGQFSVDSETLRKLNSIDNSIVRKFETENLTDQEFKLKMEQLEEIVTKKGKLLDPKVIIGSDIILPGSDLTIEEASKFFHGEGIIPGLD